MKLRNISLLAILLICTLLLTGCGNLTYLFPSRATPAPATAPESTPVPTPDSTPEPALAPTPEPTPTYDLSFTVGGQQLSATTEFLDLTQATSDEIDRLISVLPAIPNLQNMELGYADVSSPRISWEQVRAIQEVAPTVNINYNLSLGGLYSFSLSDEILNLSHLPITDGGKAVLQFAPCMPNLRIVDMDSCGVSDESMAAIRDALPGVEVIWRVFFGDSYSTRTNVERLVMSNPDRGNVRMTDDVIKGLYYCNDIKYLDLGHLSFVTDVDYVANMPNLEVLIIAMTAIKDISALASCPKLNYLEFQTTAACDLTPLSDLKQLKDLNICFNLALRDIRPIYDLDLNRLWIGCITPIPQEQIEEYRSRHPNCKINTTTENPTEEEWRKLEDGAWPPNSDPRYKQLYDEFQYYNAPGCYAYNENDPYYWRRVDFY